MNIYTQWFRQKRAGLQLTPDWTRRKQYNKSPGGTTTGHPCARNLLEAFSGTCNQNQSKMSYTSIIQPCFIFLLRNLVGGPFICHAFIDSNQLCFGAGLELRVLQEHIGLQRHR
jgi:hypothetical protein